MSFDTSNNKIRWKIMDIFSFEKVEAFCQKLQYPGKVWKGTLNKNNFVIFGFWHKNFFWVLRFTNFQTKSGLGKNFLNLLQYNFEIL